MEAIKRYFPAGSRNAPMIEDPEGDWVSWYEIQHRLAELTVADDDLAKAKRELARIRQAAKAPKAELPKAKKSRVPISKKK